MALISSQEAAERLAISLRTVDGLITAAWELQFAEEDRT